MIEGAVKGCRRTAASSRSSRKPANQGGSAGSEAPPRASSAAVSAALRRGSLSDRFRLLCSVGCVRTRTSWEECCAGFLTGLPLLILHILSANFTRSRLPQLSPVQLLSWLVWPDSTPNPAHALLAGVEEFAGGSGTQQQQQPQKQYLFPILPPPYSFHRLFPSSCMVIGRHARPFELTRPSLCNHNNNNNNSLLYNW